MDVVFPVRPCWCCETGFLCFIVELGAHSVGACESGPSPGTDIVVSLLFKKKQERNYFLLGTLIFHQKKIMERW